VAAAIANSPHDLAAHLRRISRQRHSFCRADVVTLRLSEESGLRLVASEGTLFWLSHCGHHSPRSQKRGVTESNSHKRLPAHIPDLAALEGDHGITRIVSWNAGYRATLIVPLLKDHEIIGTITLGPQHRCSRSPTNRS